MDKKQGDKKRVAVVITDLDDTLYNWFETWSQSFQAMLSKLVKQSGVSEETLIAEIKTIHERHGTAEYALLVQEIPSLRALHPGEDLTKVYADSIAAYRRKRDERLHLYPRVLETLRKIKEAGSLVVAYTESQLLYTDYRVRTLGLDGLIGYIYSPAGHDVPADLPPDQMNFYPTAPDKLRHTVHRPTPKDAEKPNPEVLLSILRDVGATREQTVYVGDSPFKDIKMAQDAGVLDIHAAYGVSDKKSKDYELLRKVTHWKATAVETENHEETVKPTHALHGSFAELLDLFEFVPFIDPLPADACDERIKEYIDVWKQTVEVQEHFNDLELRIRNLAITVLGGVLSVSALGLKEGVAVTLFGRSVQLGALLTLVALVTWITFYFMDRLWYHRLLYGSVAHGMRIEQRLRLVLPDIDLAHSIGKASPIKLRGRTIETTKKMDLFYVSIACLLIVLTGALLLMPPPAKSQEPGVVVNNYIPGATAPQDNTNSRQPSAGARDAAAPANANAVR